MSGRRSTPSSDEFRDDLNFDQLTFDNELGRKLARVQRARQGGQQLGLSERLEEHTTPLPVGVGSPLRTPFASPRGVRDALQQAMQMSGLPTVPAGVGVTSSSRSSSDPSMTAIRTAAQTLPSPTFSPRQIEVMEQILRGDVPARQIDAALDKVGLDNNQLTDYLAQRPPDPPAAPSPSPPPPSPPLSPRGPPRRRLPRRGCGGPLPGGDGTPPGSGGGGGGGGGRRGRGRGRGTTPRRGRMDQDGLRRQMDLLAEDARQQSVGRRIAGITHTNTITTVYKDGGEPEVFRTSSRLSTPNTPNTI